MAEQLVRRTRKRKVGTVKAAPQVEALLKDSLNTSAVIMDKILQLQESLLNEEAIASSYMAQLKLAKFSTTNVDATYGHPAQKTVNVFNTDLLFESVAVEDFVASVKVQKGLAEKVIDPKILKKCMSSTKSDLKPKTLKLKLKKYG